jgi:hypothetical protein
MNFEGKLEERGFTLSKNKTNRRWNDTLIRRNVWISLNSFATKHVRQAETPSALPNKSIIRYSIGTYIHSPPALGLSQSMKKISIVVCRIIKWIISIVLSTNATIKRIRNIFCSALVRDSNVSSYCF